MSYNNEEIMIFESTAKTGLKDIGKDNLIKNETILEILENIAGEHSNMVGYGALDICKTGVSWVLLDWKVRVFKRPIYSEELTVKTWGRYFKKAYTYRDFEIYNSNGELLVVATSKWVLIDVKTHNILKLSDEIKNAYKPGDIKVFEEETLSKIEVPSEFTNEIKYTVGRKDIDINNHMHNTYYINLAYEVLPEDVYNNRPYDLFRISYKNEIKLGDTITCKYAFDKGKHVVVILNEEDDIINAIIELEK